MGLLQPIVLWTPKATLTSDDACNTVLQYSLASIPSATQTPYYRSQDSAEPRSYVPRLTHFCIRSLLEYPDEVHHLGPARLRYKEPKCAHDFDILQALIPTYRPFSPNHRDFDLRVVDPRLWAVLAQVYENLPSAFREYSIPLSDAHLPLLQTIPSDRNFSLITILSLARCRELTDDTVLELRHLHTLTALDASVTALGSWGVQRFAKCLDWTDDDERQRRGPWGLRILYLKDCINVDDKILDSLSRFPLLSVVDLRGTPCQPWRHKAFPFSSTSDPSTLFKSGGLSEALGHLAALTKEPRTLFSHHAPYVLNIDSLHHRVDPTPSYRLPKNVWGAGGPDARSSDRGEVQVAKHGRMDVFLPVKYPRFRDESPRDQCDCHECQMVYIPDEHGEENADHGWYKEGDSDASESSEEQRYIGPAPQPDGGDTWMDDVADEELSLYRRQRAVDRFYASSVSDPRSLSSRRSLPGTNTAPMTPAQGPPNPLMLFRTPPPWDCLPSTPKPKPHSSAAPSSTAPSSTAHASASSPSPAKRRRVEDAAPADQARKRMYALSSIGTMHNMLQKRAEVIRAQPPSASRGPSSGVQPTHRNPFARPTTEQSSKTPRRPLAPVPVPSVSSKPVLKPQPRPSVHTLSELRTKATLASKPAVPKKRHSLPASKNETVPPVPKKLPLQAPSHPASKNETLTSGPNKPPLQAPPPQRGADDPKPGSPHSSSKKLQPISRLAVPEWPLNMKPVSAHRPKPITPSLGKERKQTTLPVSREATPRTPAAKAGNATGRRVSAPPLVPNNPAPDGRKEVVRGDDAPAAPKRKVESAPKSKADSASKVKGKPKSSGGGKSFDWKGWSARS